MRKKSTRLLSAALAVCMMASTLPVSAFAAQPAAASAESSVSTQAEEDAVAIDATNFPDGAFRQYVADNFDKDDDLEVSVSADGDSITIDQSLMGEHKPAGTQILFEVDRPILQ